MPLYARNVVATSQPLAAAAGVEALRRGGNAVDAALATAIALTVVEPTGNGIGSDAFALVWSGGTLQGLNGSGRLPAQWDPSRVDGLTEMPARGWDSVTVPGAVATWVDLSARFGRMPFSELFDAAIRYAEDGFPVSPVIAAGWARSAAVFGEFGPWRDTFLPEGRPPQAGEIVRLPDHAETLALIAETEGEAFYRGELANRIVEDARSHGTAWSLEDLANHRSVWVAPLSVEYRGCEVHEIPPNGQGLAALVALGILDRLGGAAARDSADWVHLQIEATKVGLALIAEHLADPQSMRIDPAAMLEGRALAAWAASIDPTNAADPRPTLPADPGTVLLCAADDEGMMVSFIQSNYQGFGSGVVVPGTGIAMQNRACGFRLEPGHPNEPAPSKRPFHTIIPGFATRNGQPLLAFGVMGGPMQAQGHVQMVERILGAGQDPQEASDAARWQVAGSDLWLEAGFPESTARELEARGHRVVRHQPPGLFGGAQAIMRLDDAYCAASDSRKDGCAQGF
ncbi:MAG: gamma-glutamyltransferase family protein [Chthonomonadaceae bacterium]|nr:gamma-glutamyltransferase family protein [Chthonomonadaceae bacterium]